MPSVISCPSCQKQLKVPDELVGQAVKCPGCKETFTAQVGSSPPPPPSADISTRPRKPMPPPPDEEDEPRRPVRRRDKDDDDRDDRPSRRRRAILQPHRGVLILILGIGSLVGNAIIGGVALLLGPIAWYLANQDLKEMDAGRMDPEGRQMTQIGKICGIIATVLLIIGVVVLCLVLGLFCLIPLIAGANH
jgi:predicted Zn finger-like uncharacterized protein